MDVGFKVTGSQKAAVVLKQMAEELGKDFTSLLRQEARALAVELGRVTAPKGLGESDGDVLKRFIKREIEGLFPSLEDGKRGAMRIYSMLEKVSKKRADQFWVVYQTKGKEAAEVLLTKRLHGLPRGVKRDQHRARRKSKTSLKAPAISVARPGPRDSYSRRQQKQAGQAKAGWLNSAKAIGGRVRRGGGRSGGTSNTFPSWVRKAGARKKLGTARFSQQGGRVKVTLINSVRHGRAALSFSQQLAAERRANRNFTIALASAKKFKTRKFNRKLKVA